MKKEILKQYLQDFVRWLSVRTIKKYQPGVIAVTGTVGKTSTKEAIYTVLKKHRNVRASSGNFNNEFGIPLTILGDYIEIKGDYFWYKVALVSILKLIFPFKYPELLVLEYAADKPGDIKYLLDIAKPQISVVTAIGDIPVHVEAYSGREAVIREKSKVIETLPATGFAILNHDEVTVYNMKERTRAHIMSFGFNSDSQMLISNFEIRKEDDRPIGIAFKLSYAGSFVPVRLNGAFGKSQAYAAAAAAAVGSVFGINLVKIADALKDYEVVDGRGRIIPGVKQTLVMDDTYNASPLSMEAAIDTARSIEAPRKIAVLGDMLELGEFSTEAHELIGRMVPKVFNILVTVGLRSKFIASAANEKGMAKKNIFSFDTAEGAQKEVQKLMKKGDLVLLKASHAIGLEKIVNEIKKI
ncbi:UDP-N-acetylmuramoyl-tripeptide--D-alanyl-D-alanine ligase [Candidatus Wolfebacteria bacterium]|nr:UDP-N-acetylmuramoyl-tripeptide--D-alanyl-D-alanine ligase [Candidatus Wolfebacteria bacterium]